MPEIPLMALYWTVAGPVEIHAGREWSTFSWRDRCETVAKGGFEGIGLWHADVSHQLESTTYDEMKRVLRRHRPRVPRGGVPGRLLGPAG